MKKLKLVFMTLLATTLWSFAVSANGTDPISINHPLENCAEVSTVPADVLQRFYDTFMYDEQNRFAGAYIGEIELYATLPEIKSIVINTGVTLAGTLIYEGYKPKLRGCKKNSNWICTLEGDVVDL